MTNPVDPVLGHHISQERQPAAVPGLPNDQPNQPPKQRHAEDHTEQTPTPRPPIFLCVGVLILVPKEVSTVVATDFSGWGL